LHGLVPVKVTAHADIRRFAKRRTGFAVKLGVGADMDAVGTKAFGPRDIVFNQTGDARALNKIDQAICRAVIDSLGVIAKQNASRRGTI
jgi:hypothetical protein